MDGIEKILIIDDELAPRESMRMVLKGDYSVATAEGADEGLEHLSQNPVDLIVMDIKMPRMDGITALKEIKKRHPDIEVVMLTAYASLDTARDAIRFGAFDYLLKPFDKDDVLTVVRKGLDKRRTRTGLIKERDHLLNRTSFLEEQIKMAREKILSNHEGTVKALNFTIDAKDHYTADHSKRVAKLAGALARAMDVPEETVQAIEYAASIHDIGKIGIEENILKKSGDLTVDEYTTMKKHPAIGAKIVESVPFLEEAVPVIQYHHEWYDGTGYPEGFKGEEIPLVARIVLVADAVDAMLNARPYRGALSKEKVFSELRDNAGTQFDPNIVNIILQGKVAIA